MLDSTRSDQDIRTLFRPLDEMSPSQRSRTQHSVRLIRIVRDTLIANGHGPEPTVSALLEYEIVCNASSWHLQHTRDHACSVYAGVGERSLRVIQEALYEAVGTKLTVIDKRGEISRDRRDIVL